MDVERLAWRTSSFSGDDDANGCVEVAPLPTGIAVRDTKDRALAPHHYSHTSWTALIAAVRAGTFSA